MFKIILHIAAVAFLTLITQIGGIIWILNFGLFKWAKKGKSRWTRFGLFIILYVASSILIVPKLAQLTGRVPLSISKSGSLIPHNLMTPLLNRHYVKPKLRTQLIEIANRVNAKNRNMKISYLDANFPFLDGFPLLPHLSHNDGKKIDLSFYYTKDNIEGNDKPSNTGYGKFVEPLDNERNQTIVCKSKGHWQYDFSKFLSLGGHSDLKFDSKNTKNLINQIVQDPLTQKLFIEPHLKERLKLNNTKIRFQGCHAVRHDDHIHYQIK